MQSSRTKHVGARRSTVLKREKRLKEGKGIRDKQTKEKRGKVEERTNRK
jgi:hypothetical protein